MAIAGMATNGTAPGHGGQRQGRCRPIPITDHSFDVLVVGRRRRGPARDRRLRPGGPAHRLHHEGVPDPLPHRGGAGRHLGLARQHGPGRLALAHVRHRQGVGLARRPGRDRIPVPQRARRRLRTRALGRALLAHRGGQDLPAALRRHDDRTTARAPPSAPARPPTAPATPSCTRSTARRCAPRPSSSSSISPSTSSWRRGAAAASWR